MNTKKTSMQTDQKKIIVYPILFAMYPILFLYNHNIKEAVISQIFFPLLFSIIFAFLIWGGLFLAVRDKVKSAVISTFFIFLFFSYGHIFDQLKILGYAFNFDIPIDFYLIPLFFILWVVLFYLVKKTKRDLKTVTIFLNIIGLFLVLYNAFGITIFEINKAHIPDTFKADLREVRFKKPDSTAKSQIPDIYYIILDEYAASSTIKRLYHYDNSSFVRELGELGFYIAEESRTRYKMTEQSLASSLNMCFIKKRDNFYPMIRDNRVVEILKKTGYKIIAFLDKDEALFSKSDLVFDFSQGKKSTLINEFYMTLLKTTMLRVLYEWYINEKYYSYYYRKKTLYFFEELERIPLLKGPKFVFAHIECPHWPFVFDRDGGPVNPRHFTDLKDKKYYLDQYIFISKKVKHLVEVLIDRSSSPPVIVIQSDHGPRGFGPGGGYYQLDVGDEWMRIFNAYYLPGKDNQGLYISISPFNTFRLIFNLYFNADYPLLKE